MQHEALFSHTPVYQKAVAELEKGQHLLRCLLREEDLDLNKVEEISSTLEFLRIQIDVLQCCVPDWSEIKSCTLLERKPVEVLTYLRSIRNL